MRLILTVLALLVSVAHATPRLADTESLARGLRRSIEHFANPNRADRTYNSINIAGCSYVLNRFMKADPEDAATALDPKLIQQLSEMFASQLTNPDKTIRTFSVYALEGYGDPKHLSAIEAAFSYEDNAQSWAFQRAAKKLHANCETDLKK